MKNRVDSNAAMEALSKNSDRDFCRGARQVVCAKKTPRLESLRGVLKVEKFTGIKLLDRAAMAIDIAAVQSRGGHRAF